MNRRTIDWHECGLPNDIAFMDWHQFWIVFNLCGKLTGLSDNIAFADDGIHVWE